MLTRIEHSYTGHITAAVSQDGSYRYDNFSGDNAWIKEVCTGRGMSNVYGVIRYTDDNSEAAPEVAMQVKALLDEASAADKEAGRKASDAASASRLAEFEQSMEYNRKHTSQARGWDRLQNEGMGGYNPYRR